MFGIITPMNGLRDRLLSILESAANDGSPVAGHTDEARRESAEVAARRIGSFDRRLKGRVGSRQARVEDLAKGLRDHFEPDPRLVGALMEDYRYIAGLLLDGAAQRDE